MGDTLRFNCSENHILLDNDGPCQCLPRKGNVDAQGSCVGCFGFYLLDCGCNHVIQKPEVQMHLGPNVLC